MKIVKANPSMDLKLRDFFYQNSIEGDISFTFQRSQSFFKNYEIQSNDFITFALIDQADEIHGCATLLFKNEYVGSKCVPAAWIVDQRVPKGQKAMYLWTTQLYEKVFEETKKRKAEHVFAVIYKENQKIVNSILRKKHDRTDLPTYHHVTDFQMISIHGRLPSLDSLLTSMKVKRLNPNRLEELCLYLNTHSKNRLFGVEYNPDLLAKRFESWPGFYIEDFYVVLDKKKNIQGCFHLWNAKKMQSLEITGITDFAKNFQRALKFLRLFKMAKPFPEVSEEVQFHYMTHMYADNNDIFELMIQNAYSQVNTSFLLYPSFENFLTSLPPKRFLSHSLNFGIYQVVEKGKAPDYSLKPKPFSPPPDIEACFIS
ncbi:MAG: hypothetical protein AB8E15_12105 [Bdellovibrionales bacterium]